jgi:hypothetical protein
MSTTSLNNSSLSDTTHYGPLYIFRNLLTEFHYHSHTPPRFFKTSPSIFALNIGIVNRFLPTWKIDKIDLDEGIVEIDARGREGIIAQDAVKVTTYFPDTQILFFGKQQAIMGATK